MYAYYLWFPAEESFVAIPRHFSDVAVWIHLPCGVPVVVYDAICTCQFKDGGYGIYHVCKVAHHVAALAGHYGEPLVVRLHYRTVA